MEGNLTNEQKVFLILASRFPNLLYKQYLHNAKLLITWLKLRKQDDLLFDGYYINKIVSIGDFQTTEIVEEVFLEEVIRNVSAI